MLKRSLIGLGIGLGVLAVCSMLLLAGAVTGGLISGGMRTYVTTRYVTGGAWPSAPQQTPVPPEATPHPPEHSWPWSQPWMGPQQWPRPWTGPQQWPQSLWGFLSPVVVTEVTEDGPAEAAGIEAGDIIIGVDGKALETDRDLAGVMHEHDPDNEIELTILRRGDETEILQVEVTLGSEKDDQGEGAAYLGLWYRPFGSAMRFGWSASGSGD
jgi:membrane-associated protease RseP (regulator of RpoE activity)